MQENGLKFNRLCKNVSEYKRQQRIKSMFMNVVRVYGLYNLKLWNSRTMDKVPVECLSFEIEYKLYSNILNKYILIIYSI